MSSPRHPRPGTDPESFAWWGPRTYNKLISVYIVTFTSSGKFDIYF